MSNHAQVTWTHDHVFDVRIPEGESFTLASVPGAERPGPGPSPMEAMLGAVGACSGIDVVGILGKMRKTLTSLRIEVEGTRREAEPRIFTHIVLTYHVDGPGLDAPSVLRAVELSQDKYCSVAAMIRPTVELRWVVHLNGETLAPR